jgi:outer membrane lipoprotein carrier protein
MRLLLVTLLAITPLFAIGEHTETMRADFVQTITDDRNNTITYRGDMLAKRPYKAMWHYKEPVEKRVYITAKRVTVVEPELEQAIIKKIGDNIDILAILASANKEKNGTYTAHYNDKAYHITLDNGTIKTIRFTDAFDNNVKIIFDKQQINRDIDDALFRATIPEAFDIISE